MSLHYYAPSQVYDGYTLFAPMGECGAWLIDMHGRVVHHWETDYPPARYAVLLPNGNLLYSAMPLEGPLRDMDGIGGKLLELSWEGQVVWEYDDLYMHHDFCRMENGNTMVLRFVATPLEIAAKIKGGIPGSERDGIMWTDSFQEVSPEGEVVWEWKAYEHLDPEDFPICPLDARAEWTHCNTVFVLPDGNVLACFLKQNTIAIIGKETGDLNWQWGPGELGHPHCPSGLNNGNILIFDNGTHRVDNQKAGFPLGMIAFSRILEVDPKTDEIVWEYRDRCHLDFHAPFISGCQRLPNGNTLICDGPRGRIFEVTARKEIVWEYTSPFYNEALSDVVGFTNPLFRAYRYGKDYPGLQGKNLDPNRLELTVRESPVWKAKSKPNRRHLLEQRLSRLGY